MITAVLLALILAGNWVMGVFAVLMHVRSEPKDKDAVPVGVVITLWTVLQLVGVVLAVRPLLPFLG